MVSLSGEYKDAARSWFENCNPFLPDTPSCLFHHAFRSRDCLRGTCLHCLKQSFLLLYLFGGETVSEPSYTFLPKPGYDSATTKYLQFTINPNTPGPDSTVQSVLTGVISDFLHLAIEDAQPESQDIASHRYILMVYRQPPQFAVPATLSLTIASLNL
ncbi:hypothetical protein BDZ45DRAFT_747266 [Acephala macrosclerotiorum]|nr:hypothetical protein BDZ45DRAFT_747266 [Acephala macrosclerotiorum]